MPIIHVTTTDLMHYNDEVYGFYRLSCSAFTFFLRGKESFERESNTSMGGTHISNFLKVVHNPRLRKLPFPRLLSAQ